LAQEQVENGFALQANIGLRSTAVTTGGGGGMGAAPLTVLPGAGPITELFGGYKLGRILIGLGIEFGNVTVNQSVTVGNVTTTTNDSTSAFLIGPEASFAIVRAGDGKVELIGDVALHFGHAFIPGITDNSSNFLLTYRVGPGVRFWASKHFAVTGLTGFGGELYHYIPPSSGPASNFTQDSSTHGIFGSFGLMGVF
jgi:hypothetical protein